MATSRETSESYHAAIENAVQSVSTAAEACHQVCSLSGAKNGLQDHGAILESRNRLILEALKLLNASLGPVDAILWIFSSVCVISLQSSRTAIRLVY